MKSIPVFRKGQWVQYTIPESIDPLWSKDHVFQAASFYATALTQGYNPSESDALAQAYIMKKVYSGLQYPPIIESKLKKIMGRVETA